MIYPTVDAIVDNCGYSGRCLTLIALAKVQVHSITDESTYEERLSARNRILAGEGVDADFFGTIENEPTVTKEIAMARGLKEEEAGMIVWQRDEYRKFLIDAVKELEP